MRDNKRDPNADTTVSTVTTVTTIIVGGGAAGMAAATRLRRLDEDARIILVEGDGFISSDHAGKPYLIGDVVEDFPALIRETPRSLSDRFAIDAKVATKVTALDPAARTLSIHNAFSGKDSQLTYDNLILATGAVAVLPEIPGVQHAFHIRARHGIDNIELLTQHDTHTAVILGANFISLELAENLVARGLDVTMIETPEQGMGPLDPDLAALMIKRLQANGVHVITSTELTAITAITEEEVALADGRRLPADIVILATGQRPADDLARNAGLELGPEGGILVDEQLRTSDPNILAIGDVAVKRDAIDGSPTLVTTAPTAHRHGRVAADVIAGRDVKAPPVLGTAIVSVFGLTAGVVGWSEARARRAGITPRVINLHTSNHPGYFPDASLLHLKVVVDPDTDAILGAQAVGEAGVDKRIDVLATAMRGGLTAGELADLELAYAPQLSCPKDAVNLAGLIDDNATHGQPGAQWHEVEALLADGWVALDVRTRADFAAGALPGARHLDFDELRERFDELADADRVLVYSYSGAEGYAAACLLRAAGKTVAYLSGGYNTWLAGQRATALRGTGLRGTGGGQ